MNRPFHLQTLSPLNALARFYEALQSFSRLHRDLMLPFLVVVLSRIWLALCGALVIFTLGEKIAPDPRLYNGLVRVPGEGLGLLLAPLQRWDALWYLHIAEFGYRPDDLSASFFPLYPILDRVVAIFLGQNYLLAGLLITTLATFCAFVFLYRLTAELVDASTADRAVIAWAVFPTAFFLFGAYAEAVLVACALASVYWARQKRWWLCGLAAAGATLARPIGFLIAVPLAIEGWRAGTSLRQRLLTLVPLCAIAAAMGVWMLYLQLQFQDALLWAHAEEYWGRIFVIPGQTIIWTIQSILRGGPATGTNLMDLALTLVIFMATFAGLKRLPPSLSAYSLLMLIVPLASYASVLFWPSLPMAAAGRRALVVFPAFMVVAMRWRSQRIFPLWVLLAAMVETLLFVQYVMWIWVD